MPSADLEIYDALDHALSRLGVRWFVFGAQAAILYGATRFTEDIDVTVDGQAVSSSALVAALKEHGFALRVDDVDGFVNKTRVLPLEHVATGFPVDVVLSGPGLEELFFQRTRRITVAGRSVPVAAAEDIVVMKVLAGRPKDLEDVVAIVAANAKSLDKALVRETLHLIEQALDQRDLLPEFERCLERSGAAR